MRQLPALIVLLAGTVSTVALAQTVVVGGEGRNSVDVNYDVLQLLGPAPDGPAPAYQAPQPQYQQPYQQPVQPQYQQPYQAPVQQQYQQPYQTYQPAPQQVYGGQFQPVQPRRRSIQAEDLPFSVGPLTDAETAGGFDSVTVVGSPDMEQQALQTGQVHFTEGTHQLVGNLRGSVGGSSMVQFENSDVPTAKPVKVTTARTSLSGPEFTMGQSSSVPPQPVAPQPMPEPMSDPMPAPMMTPEAQAPAQAPAPIATSDPASLSGPAVAAPESWQQNVPTELLTQARQAPSGNPAFASVVFPPNSAAVTPVAEQKVGAAARQEITSGGSIEIVSRVPSTTANNRPALRMALRRALVVRNTLVAQGMPEDRIQIRALLTLVSSEDEVQSRDLNRVELVRL